MNRKLVTFFITMLLVLNLAACSNSGTPDNTTSEGAAPSQSERISENESVSAELTQTQNDTDSKILVVYFTAAENSGVDAISSASVVMINGEAKGVVRSLADVIAEETGGDMFAIQTDVIYPADIGELIDYAAGEQNDNARPELITSIENLDEYDTVFVGYPNWWYDLPMPMYSFFEEYDFSGKKIIPFNTHRGSRFSQTIETIQELEPEAMVITDGFTVSHEQAEGAADDVSKWLTELGY